MKAGRILGAAVGLAVTAGVVVGLGACNQQTVEATLRSLEASSEVTFVCRGERPLELDEAGYPKPDRLDRGFELSDCPDFSVPRTRTMTAIVTQTATNELAVISVDDKKVVDVNPSIPGYTFLRLPSRPGDIVSSPGGEASFVGLTSTGKTGIAAIPTTCLGPPRAKGDGEAAQHMRDVTTFAACTLPSVPGDMAVLVEPPDENDVISETCGVATPERKDPPGARREPLPDEGAAGAAGAPSTPDVARDCVANLTTEPGPVGRRKLVVTMPDLGQLWVIDAQALLDRAPGSFDPCPEPKIFDLDAAPDVSGQKQELPQDFAADSCTVAEPTPPPVPPSAVSRPSGLAVADGRLFVGDLGVPAVHVIDASTPCSLKELPPLLPMSYARPSRVVTTSRVAASPVTPDGKRYVYAVDTGDQPASSVMAFDVSEGATVRTPIMRTGSVRQPREAPDRIAFATPVADIAFAYRDLPKFDLETGVAEIGVRCDPDPTQSVDPPSPSVQYRTTPDFTQGARPTLLRGLFGLVMLTNGVVVVIDVDDFDADCRRPISTNADATPDFRGCANDPWFDGADGPRFLTYKVGDDAPTGSSATATPSVSGEVSCNMVEPHRARAANFGISTPTLGLGAPSLRGFPQFDAPQSVVNRTTEDRPKLLAAPFESASSSDGIYADVYVGTTRYGGDTGAELPIDPSATNDRNSVALPLVEPRSYPSNDHNVLTYEGRVLAGDPPSGFLKPLDTGGWALEDPTAYFCNQGVYDEEAMGLYAGQELGMSPTELADDALKATLPDGSEVSGTFAALHGDYVQITGDFPDILDTYWQSERGVAAGGRQGCDIKFGSPPRRGDSELETTRDFRIVEAYQGHLLIEPRQGNPMTVEDLVGCFPGGFRYAVRGSRQWVLATSRPDVAHDIFADAARDYRCARDCDPRKKLFRSRVFEIGKIGGCDATAEVCSHLAVGDASDLDGPCSYDPIVAKAATRGILLSDERARACIFENLTSRFAVYRGRQPSVRDMTFSWDTAGGFVPLTGSLAAVSSGVLPRHLSYVPEYQAIAVVDGANLGLSFMSLDSLRIHDPWPVY